MVERTAPNEDDSPLLCGLCGLESDAPYCDGCLDEIADDLSFRLMARGW